LITSAISSLSSMSTMCGLPSATLLTADTGTPAAASAAAVSVAPGALTVATAPITTTDVAAPQPRTATYSCAGGDRITIENLGTSLHVLSADGTAEDLPASPANQNSRYQEAATHDAIVIDGREALVMKRGKTPVSCKR
jgi:membrane-bound inhibitor of C-type lysozyme